MLKICIPTIFQGLVKCRSQSDTILKGSPQKALNLCIVKYILIQKKIIFVNLSLEECSCSLLQSYNAVRWGRDKSPCLSAACSPEMWSFRSRSLKKKKKPLTINMNIAVIFFYLVVSPASQSICSSSFKFPQCPPIYISFYPRNHKN